MGNLIALAIFPTAISFLCTTQAVQYIGSTPTAILGALEPVTAVFFGVTIFGESLTPRLCCGIVLIIMAVTFIIAGSNITTHLVRFRKLFPRLPLKHPKNRQNKLSVRISLQIYILTIDLGDLRKKNYICSEFLKQIFWVQFLNLLLLNISLTNHRLISFRLSNPTRTGFSFYHF